MHKYAASLLMFVVLVATSWTGFLPDSAQAQASPVKQHAKNLPGTTTVPGHVIVKLKAGSFPGSKEVRELWKELGTSKAKPLFKEGARRGPSKAKAVLDNTFLLQVPNNSIPEAVHRLRRSGLVEYAEPNYVLQTHLAPNDPYYGTSGSWGQGHGDLWGLHSIQAEQAWDATLGKGVTVAVVDTGVDYDHPDLASNIWQNIGEMGVDAQGGDKRTNGIDDDSDGYVDDWRGWDTSSIITEQVGNGLRVSGSKEPDNDPMDDAGHGTHVAGTIGALGNNGLGVIGVAPDATIMPLKFMTKDGAGTSEDAARAIIFAVDHGADIINNSWGGEDPSRIVEAAIDYAHQNGTVVIASAGNSGTDNWGNAPAMLTKAITVAALNPDGTKAGFSSYGKVDVAAPGVNILSTRSSQSARNAQLVGDEYEVLSGTSMAAPHVAGLAALILAQNPSLDNEEVRHALTAAAIDTGQSGADTVFGSGIIDAEAALQQPPSGVAVLSGPLGERSASDIPIEGLITLSDFHRYALEYGVGANPASWTEFANTPAIPADGTLGTLHVTTYGRFTVRLNTHTTSGRVYQSLLAVNRTWPQSITNVNVASFSPTETNITWTLQNDRYSFVEFGTDTTYGKKAVSASGTNGAANLLGLLPATRYHYRVVTQDIGTTIATPDATFTTPPEILTVSNVQVTRQPHQATITWETNLPSTSTVRYNDGAWASSYQYSRNQSVASDPALTTSHRVTLAGLNDGMAYYFLIQSKDSSDNGATYGPSSFVTPPGQYATITNLEAIDITEEGATVAWDTDIPTTARLTCMRYGSPYNLDVRGSCDIVLSEPALHHRQTLTGWTSGSQFSVQVAVISADGSRTYSSTDIATLPSPRITGLTVSNVTDGSATVSWQTDIPTTSTVGYMQKDPVAGYPTKRVDDPILTTNHTVKLTNLVPGAQSSIQVEGQENGNTYLSGIQEFTTTSSPEDTIAPTGSISINGGAAYTTTTNVLLDLPATDNYRVGYMAVSDNVGELNYWRSYSPQAWYAIPFHSDPHTIYVRYRDYSGNVSATYSGTVTLDTSPPNTCKVTVSDGAMYTNSRQVPLSLDCSNDPGPAPVSSYRYSTDDKQAYSDWLPYTTYGNVTLSAGDGQKTVYVDFRDAAGRMHTSSDTIILDSSAPLGSVSLNNGAAYTSSRSVRLDVTAQDQYSSLFQYSLDGTTYSTFVNCPALVYVSLPGEDGLKTVFVRFKDGLGNMSDATRSTITLDTKAPSGSLSVNGGNNFADSSDVVLDLMASDEISGVVSMQFSTDGQGFSDWEAFVPSRDLTLPAGDGAKTVYVRFMDGAGNISPTYSDSITVDISGISGEVSVNDGSRFTSSAQAVLTADLASTSGMSRMRVVVDGVEVLPWQPFTRSSTITLPGSNGAKVVDVYAENGLGNQVIHSTSIILDTTPATGSLIISGGVPFTNTPIVSLGISATDSLSGIASMQFSTDGSTYSDWEAYSTTKNYILTGGGGLTFVYVRFRDKAGNISDPILDTITLDTAGPTGSIRINNNAAKTKSTAVTLNLSANDTVSGVKEMSFSNDKTNWSPWKPYAASSPWTLTAGRGTKTVYVRFRDQAGNISAIYSDSISY